MNSEHKSVSELYLHSSDTPGRSGYCHDVACKKAVSNTSGIPENFFQRFQSAENAIRLGAHDNRTCAGLHIRWALIAFSMSPAKTCRPGQNADRESIVKYAASPEWILMFLNLSEVQCHQYLKLDKGVTHPEPIGCSWVAHHSSITLMPNVQEFNFAYQNSLTGR